MNRLASILSSAQVLVQVDVSSKKRAFEEAGLLFENLHGLSRALVTDSLFSRERLGSTGLGHGVAIPHGRIKGLKSPMAAVFQLANPIGFEAPDELPVDIPAGAGSGHSKTSGNPVGDCRIVERL
jgi:PTS system nitrogen regulatory IIA component